MKAILGGIVAAVIIAAGAALVLDKEVQRSSTAAFATLGVRL